MVGWGGGGGTSLQELLLAVFEDVLKKYFSAIVTRWLDEAHPSGHSATAAVKPRRCDVRTLPIHRQQVALGDSR